MDKFSRRKTPEPNYTHTSLPPIPATCGKCEKPTDVVFIRVLNKQTGELEAGYFSGSHKRKPYGRQDNRTGELVLFDNYAFKNWIARCIDCYDLDCIEDKKRIAARNRING